MWVTLAGTVGWWTLQVRRRRLAGPPAVLRIAASLAAAVSSLACAWFLSGGQMISHDLSSDAAESYRAAFRVQVANNARVEAPRDRSWHVIRKGVAPKLFEREADGTGILIHNHWTAADGDHFFVSADANGWEYVIPTIGSTDARATRLVYLGVTTSRQDGVERPAGTPAIRCILALTHKKCSTPATGRVSATLKAGQEAFALGRYSALPFMQCVASPRGGFSMTRSVVRTLLQRTAGRGTGYCDIVSCIRWLPETWLGVFSEDLESYAVYQHGVDTPILMLSGTQGENTAKQVLIETCDMMIFERIEVAQSVLSNIVVEITGPTTATATDYFNHWEIIDPEYPANVMQGYDGDHWYFNSGKHEYELTKKDGKWMITKFRGEMFYSEVRERQDIKLGE